MATTRDWAWCIPFALCLIPEEYERAVHSLPTAVYRRAVVCEYAHERLRQLLAGAARGSVRAGSCA